MSAATPKETLITKEGLQKLQAELEDLKGPKSTELAARLKEAVAQGDLSENAEYAEAKEAQELMIIRISELEEQIKNAQVIKEEKGNKKGEIIIGCQVKIKNLSKDLPEETYTIVGSVEADPFEHKISNVSPLGVALLGKKKGEKVTLSVPAGEMTYEIKDVK